MWFYCEQIFFIASIVSIVNLKIYSIIFLWSGTNMKFQTSKRCPACGNRFKSLRSHQLRSPRCLVLKKKITPINNIIYRQFTNKSKKTHYASKSKVSMQFPSKLDKVVNCPVIHQKPHFLDGPLLVEKSNYPYLHAHTLEN